MQVVQVVIQGGASDAGGDAFGDIGHASRDTKFGSATIGYVKHKDGIVYRPWEDPKNKLFETKPALILDINGFLLASMDSKNYVDEPS